MKSALALATLSAMMLSGCATKEYVHEYVQAQMNPVGTRVGAVETRTGALEARADGADAALAETGKRLDGAVSEIQVTLKVHAARIAKTESDISQLSKTAQDAVERANSAGKLAQGKLVYEVVLYDDKLKFGQNKS
nr:hypothetical protein [Thiobacillaceae bacterium]